MVPIIINCVQMILFYSVSKLELMFFESRFEIYFISEKIYGVIVTKRVKSANHI